MAWSRSSTARPRGGAGRRAAPGLLAQMGWTEGLVWFMRTLAWVWVAKGLFNWSLVLGAFPGYGDFAMLPLPLQGSSCSSPRSIARRRRPLARGALGGVLWLLCAVIEAVSPALGARGAMTGAVGVALDALLVALYFLLSWRAGQERF